MPGVNVATGGGATIGLAAVLTVVATKTSGYTAVAGQEVPVDSTGGPFTVTLPSAPTQGARVKVVDVTGATATNPVTIAPAGGDTVRGGTSLLLDDGGRVSLYYDVATHDWRED